TGSNGGSHLRLPPRHLTRPTPYSRSSRSGSVKSSVGSPREGPGLEATIGRAATGKPSARSARAGGSPGFRGLQELHVHCGETGPAQRACAPSQEDRVARRLLGVNKLHQLTPGKLVRAQVARQNANSRTGHNRRENPSQIVDDQGCIGPEVLSEDHPPVPSQNGQV